MAFLRGFSARFALLFLILTAAFTIPVLAFDYRADHGQSVWRLPLKGEWEFREKGQKDWRTARLPQLLHREGTFYYRRNLEFPPEWSGRPVLLVLEGVNFSVRMRLNGQYLGSQLFGNVPVQVFVPPEIMRFGEPNRLELEVETGLSMRSIPLKHALLSPEPLRGVFRNAFFLAVSPIAISDVDISAEGFSTGKTVVHTIVRIRMDERLRRQLIQEGQTQLQVTLQRRLWPEGRPGAPLFAGIRTVNLPLEQEVTVGDSLNVGGVNLWEPLKPDRYTLEYSLKLPAKGGSISDVYRTNIGFRNLAAGPDGILLNGSPLRIRGVTLVEDSLRWLSSRERALHYLREVQSLGFNTVVWFIPPPQFAFSLTDSLGLLSFVRLPIWNVPGKILNDADYQNQAGQMLKTLLAEVRNHPSVAFFSLGEGYDAQHPATVPFVRLLRENFPAAPGFLVTAGIRSQSPSAAELPIDFLTVNLTYRWLLHWEHWITEWQVEHPDVPLLFSDVYAPYVAPSSDPEQVVGYESAQSYYLKQAIEQILNHQAAGFVLSSLFDYCSAYPTVMAVYAEEHRVFPLGLASLDERPRMVWNVVRDLNVQAGTQFKLARREPGGADNIFIIWGLATLAVFLFFFRRNHHLRGNFVRVLMRPFGFRMELREGRKIAWSNTLMILFGIVSTWGLLLASVAFYLRRHPLYDYFLSLISPTQGINQLLIELSWNPVEGILGFSAFSALVMLIVAVYLSVLGIFSRTKIGFRNAMTFVVWENSIFLFLLPLAFVFVRMVGVAPLRIPLILLFVLFMIWSVYRLFKGARLIYLLPAGVILLLLIVIPLSVLAVILLIYDQQRSFLAQIEYLRHIWKVRL